MSLLWGLLACKDPAMAPYREALSQWEAGKLSLEQGKPEDALAHFVAAREKDPASASLRLWEAKALAAAGRYAEADQRVTELIRDQPDLGVAWYNRAAWRVRAGRTLEAAQDLQKALELGEGSRLQAAADPDFVAVRTKPEFASFLPDRTLLVEMKGPEGAVFVQSRLELVLRLVSLPGVDPILRREGPDPGCARLERVVEDRTEAPGEWLRTITFTLLAVRRCEGRIGPFRLQYGEEEILIDPVPLRVEAPASYAEPPPPPPLPLQLPLPGSAALAGFEKAPSGPGIQLELRTGGQTVAKGSYQPP
ncbi:MAG TPA: tetratricopeptide repeat protein [Myxococcota bacterium]|nr:tetratricopeptide repeat protein [Myxococcota bacterium]